MSQTAENIERLRLKRKMTQAELAAKLSVPEGEVSRWETGEAAPDIGMLVSIAETLRTDVETLLAGVPDTKSRKRAVLGLGLACGVAFILGGVICYLTPWVAYIKNSYYIFAPMIIMRVVVLPVFWLLMGWAVMQALGLAGIAKRVPSRTGKPLRIALMLAVLLYAAVMLPFVIEHTVFMIQFLQARQKPLLQSEGLQYVSHIPASLLTIEWQVIVSAYNWAGIFAFPGIIFWLTKPAKKKLRCYL